MGDFRSDIWSPRRVPVSDLLGSARTWEILRTVCAEICKNRSNRAAGGRIPSVSRRTDAPADL